MNEQEQIVGIYGLILKGDDQILIVRRAEHDSHGNLWELPGGGLEFGEDPKEGVSREVLEETGLTVTVGYPLTVVSARSTTKSTRQVIRIAYLCTLSRPQQTVQLSHEHSSYQWISLTNPPTLEYADLFIQILKEIDAHPLLIAATTGTTK